MVFVYACSGRFSLFMACRMAGSLDAAHRKYWESKTVFDHATGIAPALLFMVVPIQLLRLKKSVFPLAISHAVILLTCTIHHLLSPAWRELVGPDKRGKLMRMLAGLVPVGAALVYTGRLRKNRVLA